MKLFFLVSVVWNSTRITLILRRLGSQRLGVISADPWWVTVHAVRSLSLPVKKTVQRRDMHHCLSSQNADATDAQTTQRNPSNHFPRNKSKKKWVIVPLSAFCWTYCKYFPADLLCLREALSPASAHASCYKLICILDTFTPTELPMECFLSTFASVQQQRELAPSSVC